MHMIAGPAELSQAEIDEYWHAILEDEENQTSYDMMEQDGLWDGPETQRGGNTVPSNSDGKPAR